MNVYTKINTLYKRYVFDGKTCPNKKWLAFKNKIILGDFSNVEAKYLFNNLWEGYSKIDGTNSKIVYFPSTGKIEVGGKSDKADSQHGQFEMLQEIADRIKPQLAEMFPKESAKFAPIKEGNKLIYHDIWPILKEVDEKHDTATIETKFDKKEIISSGMCAVELEEVPVYIYGEYYGQGIQKCGGRYIKDANDFIVFDIDMQGWWIPKDMRDEICAKLNLKTVPFVGVMTLHDIEHMVRQGFTTKMDGASDPTLLEEGIVARPAIPVLDSRGHRIIVKVKYCDYVEYDAVRSQFTDEEFAEFNNWYHTEVENKK